MSKNTKQTNTKAKKAKKSSNTNKFKQIKKPDTIYPNLHGVVSYFNDVKGYGYISYSNFGDHSFYVAYQSIISSVTLRPNQEVIFDGNITKKLATNVKISPKQKYIKVYNGTVTFWHPKREYGFIQVDDNSIEFDVYFNGKSTRNCVTRKGVLKPLTIGERVEFQIDSRDNKAFEVKRILRQKIKGKKEPKKIVPKLVDSATANSANESDINIEEKEDKPDTKAPMKPVKAKAEPKKTKETKSKPNKKEKADTKKAPKREPKNKSGTKAEPKKTETNAVKAPPKKKSGTKSKVVKAKSIAKVSIGYIKFIKYNDSDKNKFFGFIETLNDNDIYFNNDSISDKFMVERNQEITYELQLTKRINNYKEYKAINIKPTGNWKPKETIRMSAKERKEKYEKIKKQKEIRNKALGLGGTKLVIKERNNGIISFLDQSRDELYENESTSSISDNSDISYSLSSC